MECREQLRKQRKPDDLLIYCKVCSCQTIHVFTVRSVHSGLAKGISLFLETWGTPEWRYV